MRILVTLLGILLAVEALPAQRGGPGRGLFEERCAACHGGDGNGGEFAPGIVGQLSALNDAALAAIVRSGIPSRGMPPFKLDDAAMAQLIAHLRTLRSGRSARELKRLKVQTTDGKTLDGVVTGQGIDDLQLRTADQRVRILRRAGDTFREVTSQTDWPTYDGQYTQNRYSTLKQIDKSNVAKLAPRWIFPMDETTPLQTTPLVVEGIMYVTTGNQCFALDPGTGRQIWHFQRPRTQGLTGNASGGINRGAAVTGDRVFLMTDNAHLLALNRFTGALAWDVELADFRQNYSATAAPLIAGGLVVTGVAGGDSGARGFVAAFDPATGAERWRFWTTPKPGEPGSETWKGTTIEHPGGATWFTGSYDESLGTVYWGVGNPGEDLNGDQRLGDNLYSDCVVALDVKTGNLKWYYQFTPHDLWDWDAQQPLVLVDAAWEGKPRKLLLDANRNGFFYVLDRTDGKLLLAKPFVKNITWAREIGADGRPVLNENQQPSQEGQRVCPALIGAANWWATSYNPATGLFYVQTLESCAIFSKRDTKWEAGKGFNGGTTRESPEDKPQKFIRAIDIKTGKLAWELPEVGPGTSRGGTMTTAGGLVFFCADSDALEAVDATNGKPLWHFQTNHFWRASPMTYVFDNKQYVAVSSGPNIISFALPD